MIELRYGKLDFVLVIFLGIFLAIISPAVLAFKSLTFGIGRAEVNFGGRVVVCPLSIYVLLLSPVIVVAVHEFIHMVVMLAMGVRFKVNLNALGIMLGYEEMYVWQYIIVALSPQILTLALRLASQFSKLAPLLIFMAVINLASSSGDFYGVLKTLIKVRGVRRRIEMINIFRYKII